jgi:exopolyphosphatase/guanosine-5'-triphosphate,3'-diphosphate pyrophosphatase
MQTQKFCALLRAYKADHMDIMHRVLRLAPERIHTSIPGLTVLKTVAKSFGSKTIVVSGDGVREGYLYDRVMGECSPECKA